MAKFTITRETTRDGTFWGFELVDAYTGIRITRQLPCWDTKREAVRSAKFHMRVRGLDA